MSSLLIKSHSYNANALTFVSLSSKIRVSNVILSVEYKIIFLPYAKTLSLLNNTEEKLQTPDKKHARNLSFRKINPSSF